jgi:hypothetical protein
MTTRAVYGWIESAANAFARGALMVGGAQGCSRRRAGAASSVLARMANGLRSANMQIRF